LNEKLVDYNHTTKQTWAEHKIVALDLSNAIVFSFMFLTFVFYHLKADFWNLSSNFLRLNLEESRINLHLTEKIRSSSTSAQVYFKNTPSFAV